MADHTETEQLALSQRAEEFDKCNNDELTPEDQAIKDAVDVAIEKFTKISVSDVEQSAKYVSFAEYRETILKLHGERFDFISSIPHELKCELGSTVFNEYCARAAAGATFVVCGQHVTPLMPKTHKFMNIPHMQTISCDICLLGT